MKRREKKSKEKGGEEKTRYVKNKKKVKDGQQRKCKYSTYPSTDDDVMM